MSSEVIRVPLFDVIRRCCGREGRRRELLRTVQITMPAFLIAMLWAMPVPARPARAEADSLCRLGQQALDGGDTDRAEDLFSKALVVDKKHAGAHCGLGYVYLGRRDLKRARKAFQKAERYERKMPEAYNGLGQVYALEKGEWVRAVRYFCRALAERPDYVEAQYNIGMVHLGLLNRDGIKAFEKVVEMDPDHPDAYFRLGYLYEMDLLKPREAAVYYEKQLEVNPEHRDAMWRLGQIYRKQARTGEAAETLTRLMRSDGALQRHYMLELAAVYLEKRDYEKAEKLFETYLAGLHTIERQPYDDVGPVCTPAELDAYHQTSGEARRTFVERFWKRRDPTPITEVNERRVEHYRRVAYAREHFGGAVQPWDRRGEVYVRYGEPDHRSGSADRHMEATPGTREVKQRLLDRADWAAEELLTDYAAARVDSTGSADRGAESMRGRRVLRPGERRRWRWQEPAQQEGVLRRAEAAVASGGILDFLGRPIFPITERTAWEYWIYTGVDGGIEIVFTQMPGAPDGVFDYAALPGGMSVRRRRLWAPMQPDAVMRRAIAAAPESYAPQFPDRPLSFAAYPATFRGRDDSTQVEVYYGFPASDLTSSGEEVWLRRGAVLYNAAGDPVYLKAGRKGYRVSGEAGSGVVPDAVSLMVSPGAYYLAVQAVEESTGRTQIYSMPLKVPSYAGGNLGLSDIELAASVEPASSPGAFVKNELRVIPLATRFYPRQLNVSIYYEIYGLTRDEFGQAKYGVAYTIRPGTAQSFGARVLGGFGRLLGVEKGEEGITISYDQVGTAGDVASYLAVDMSGSNPGEYTMEVAVTDRQSGREVSRTTVFKLE